MRKIGHIVKAKGLKGTYFIDSVPEDLQELTEGTKVHVGYSENFTREFHVKSWAKQRKGANVLFIETQVNDTPGELLEKAVFIEDEEIKNSIERLYTEDDTAGFKVLDENSNEIGTITEIWEMPAHEIWVVDTGDGTVPVPAVDEYILSVDKIKKQVVIRLIEGLMDLNNGEEDE